MNFYDFSAKTIDGKEIPMSQYKGKVVIIVNTASKCGFTPQYEELERINKEYKSKGVEILGFPCNQFDEQEPGNNEDVLSFCKLNYGVTFQLFEKIEVRGNSVHPLFKYLSEASEFKGFELDKMSGKIIYGITAEKYPEYLVDNSVKWNFTKFLIDKEGNVVGRFEPTTEPADMIPQIEKLL